jgi:hypothetical protein
LTAAVASNTSTSMARCWAFPSFVQRYSTSGNLLLRDITQNRFPGKFCYKLMVCCDLRISNLGTNIVTPGFKGKSECKNTCAPGSSYTHASTQWIPKTQCKAQREY